MERKTSGPRRPARRPGGGRDRRYTSGAHRAAPPRQKPELLAPAGRPEAFLAALDAGADAVYVGTQQFNARLRAQNFSMEELSRLTAYAHSIGRKVYVTVNTLIEERELPEMTATLDALRRMGPDALIIQDLGVYRMARRIAPGIPLHASTQMTIHNLDGALQAQHMGFQRVILARELTLEEIRFIRASSTIELETFIHGALCYSVSGQCLFSSFAHGMSANRGRCLQPCRRVFEMETAWGGVSSGTLFSTRDLNTASILSQLMSCGIRSFKIEGRLKPAATITQIVRAYRMLIDAAPHFDKETVTEAWRRLNLAVGREPCTSYYLSPEPQDLLGGTTSSHSGQVLGEAYPATKGRFALIPAEPVKTGDRLRVQVSRGEPPKGFTVQEMFGGGMPVKRARRGQRVEIAAPFAVPSGALVIKAADTDAVERGAARRYEQILASATEPSRAALPATLEVGNRELTLLAHAGDRSVRIAFPVTGRGDVSRGDAVHILNSEGEGASVRLSVRIKAGAADVLNVSERDVLALRDRALDRLQRLLDKQREDMLEDIARTPERQPVEPVGTVVRINTLEEAERILGISHDVPRPISLIMPVEEALRKEFRPFAERREIRPHLILSLPALQFVPDERSKTIEALRSAMELGIRRFEVGNLGHLALLRGTGRKGLWVLVAPTVGCLNSQSHAQLVELGADVVTYSIEGSRSNLADLSSHIDPRHLAVQIYGYVPLFCSRAPGPSRGPTSLKLTEPNQNLRTERRRGLLIVMPERPFSLCRYQETLKEVGPYGFTFDFTFAMGELDRASEILTSSSKRGTGAESTFNFERS